MSVTLRNLPSRYIWAGVIMLVALVILGAVYWKNSRSIVRLRPHGQAVFYRGGFFRQDEFILEKQGTKWLFYRGEPLEAGELILPFECPYNNSRTLRLEVDGRVYVLDKDKMDRFELRVVNGEWSYNATDHWQSIFDLE